MASITESVTHRHTQERQSNIPWLAHLELLWLAALAVPILLPGAIVPAEQHVLVVLALFLFWPIHYLLAKRRSAAGTVAERPIALPVTLKALLLWLPINLLVAGMSLLAWSSAGYLLLGVALYSYCLRHPWLRHHPERLAFALVALGGALLLAIPFIEWKSAFRLFYVPLYDWFSGSILDIGETIHANVLAGALVTLLPLVAALALPLHYPRPRLKKVNPNPGAEVKVLQLHIQRRRPYGRIVATGLVIFMATLLLLTQSRGAYLATATALGLLGVLRWRRLFALLPIFAIGVGITIYQLGWSRIFDLLGSDNTFGGAGFRTVIWHADQRALHDFFWTGIGLGRFTEVMRLLYPSPIIQSPSATHAHNLLLQIGLDLGGPGLLAWLGLYLTLIGMTIAVLRRTASPTGSAESLDATWDGTQFIAPPHVDVTISTRRFVRRLTKVERRRQQQWLLAAGCLAALVGIQIHGLLDAVTWGNKLAFIPWLLFALVTLLYDSTSPSTAQSPVTSDKQSHPLHPKYGDLHTPIDPTMNP